MTTRRVSGLVGPITVGTALLAIGAYARTDQLFQALPPEDEDTSKPNSLPRVKDHVELVQSKPLRGSQTPGVTFNGRAAPTWPTSRYEDALAALPEVASSAPRGAGHVIARDLDNQDNHIDADDARIRQIGYARPIALPAFEIPIPDAIDLNLLAVDVPQISFIPRPALNGGVSTDPGKIAAVAAQPVTELAKPVSEVPPDSKEKALRSFNPTIASNNANVSLLVETSGGSGFSQRMVSTSAPLPDGDLLEKGSALPPKGFAPPVAPQERALFSETAISSQPDTELPSGEQQSTDFSPGKRVFPSDPQDPLFDYENELILQVRVKGVEATDTIVGYGTRDGVYLPLGELARILDLAIRVGDDGNYASGWFLSEDRSVEIDARERSMSLSGVGLSWPTRSLQAFEGEMFLRSDVFADLFPLEIEPDLRSQSVVITTLEPFPFEKRMQRDADRRLLAGRGATRVKEQWPREETPWVPLSLPFSDVDARVVSDSVKGTRGELDLRMSGDLAWMTAQGFLSVTTRDGVVAALVELGRRDVDADLLGPMRATEFQIGDVATQGMPLGLRGTAGRGGFVTNQKLNSASVFDQIELRGLLPDGYEVELYRNDILVASTSRGTNGQYEFAQVPVDYGLNIFRLVFYGPQGQRREEIKQISVGDGRISPGELEYSFGAVQRNVNLLGIEGPDFRPQDRYGEWQAIGQVSYGISQSLTGIASAAYFQDDGQDRWLATAGVRTGIASLAVRGDLGLTGDGGKAIGVGIGGRALGGAFTISHFEYRGNFIDELRTFGSDPLRRATDFDLNLSLGIPGILDGTVLPITARARRAEFADGRTQTSATIRGSLRVPGFIASNTLELSHNASPLGSNFIQLAGDFDLATFNRSSTQIRGTVGYRIAPDPSITLIGAEVDHAFDERTIVRGSAAYSLDGDALTLGASAIREFNRFTLAFDSQYSLDTQSYSVALRVGFSFGRDPLRRSIFVDSPNLASSGAFAARVYHDLDGDLRFGPGDLPLKGVGVAAFNTVSETDDAGLVRLSGLGNGNRVSIQVDPATLSDIYMAPASKGIEIVPRAGRFHVAEFPVLSLSEIEGTVSVRRDDGFSGVAGVRIGFENEAGEMEDWARTERGGYFFYERMKPGIYRVLLDPEQSDRYELCLASPDIVTVPPTGDVINLDLVLENCAK